MTLWKSSAAAKEPKGHAKGFQLLQTLGLQPIFIQKFSSVIVVYQGLARESRVHVTPSLWEAKNRHWGVSVSKSLT